MDQTEVCAALEKLEKAYAEQTRLVTQNERLLKDAICVIARAVIQLQNAATGSAQ